MPSIISHAAVAVGAGIAFAPRDIPNRFWFFSIVCSVAPDLDIIGFFFGIPYSHFFGHRGFFHSPFFGLLISIFLVGVFFRDVKIFSKQWFFFFTFFFLITASHGIFDAFTNGGMGIPLLLPFDHSRYFFPWAPIRVSPIGIKDFFSPWGVAVMKSELLLVWLPVIFMVMVSKAFRLITVKQWKAK